MKRIIMGFTKIFITYSTIVLNLLFISQVIAGNNSLTQTEFEHISNLTLSEQKKSLSVAFKKRIEFAENLFYHNEVHTELCKIIDGKRSMPIENSISQRNYAYWYLKKDYRFDIEFFDPRKKGVNQRVTDCWDSKEGVSKSILKNEETDRIFGRVDTVFDRAVLFNDTYAFWLQGGSSETYQTPHYLFPFLLDNEEKWTLLLLPEEKKIQLTVPFDPGEYGTTAIKSEGKIILTLEPEKAYMPLSGFIRGDLFFQDGRQHWREESFTVKNTQLVDNIWMPIKLITSISAASYPDNQLSVTTITVTEIEHGKVTKSDVVMKFPEGAEVVDAIKGISYKTDANGNPIELTIEPLYGLDPSQVKMPTKKSRINFILITAGIILILTGLYLQFKKRRESN